MNSAIETLDSGKLSIKNTVLPLWIGLVGQAQISLVD
jgi:hypothetical protein